MFSSFEGPDRRKGLWQFAGLRRPGDRDSSGHPVGSLLMQEVPPLHRFFPGIEAHTNLIRRAVRKVLQAYTLRIDWMQLCRGHLRQGLGMAEKP
jgi:hypothetical protein